MQNNLTTAHLFLLQEGHKGNRLSILENSWHGITNNLKRKSSLLLRSVRVGFKDRIAFELAPEEGRDDDRWRWEGLISGMGDSVGKAMETEGENI